MSFLLTEALKENYDGIIVGTNSFNKYGIEYDEVIAFKPNQIKSVDNKGAFDENDFRINYAKISMGQIV